jgi:hypothetical protein
MTSDGEEEDTDVVKAAVADILLSLKGKKCKAIPVTGCGGP